MNKVYIIAEAGVNHNGSLILAKKLIDEAKKAGADAVKFQFFKSDKLVTNTASKAEYQTKTTDEKETQQQMLKKLELTLSNHKELKDYADSLLIDFMSSPFDVSGIQELKDLGMKVFKVPSGEITNYPYLLELSRLSTDYKIILSTGMSNISEIKDAVNVLKSNGNNNIQILHCNTEYPTPFEDVNMNVLKTLQDEFNYDIGFSDHTNGIVAPIVAVSLGAKVIEKHFTLDKTMEGPDHKASLEPNELKEMVSSIRIASNCLGSYTKEPTKSETKNIKVARKSIVAKKDIKKGEKFTNDNLTTKRPGTGISPMKWNEIINTVATKDYSYDDII